MNICQSKSRVRAEVQRSVYLLKRGCCLFRFSTNYHMNQEFANFFLSALTFDVTAVRRYIVYMKQ